MEIHTIWRPFTGDPSTPRRALPNSAFAFPAERAEPLTDDRLVCSAVARFNQVYGVSDAVRDAAFDNIKAAALHYGVDIAGKSWRDIGREKWMRADVKSASSGES